MPFPNLPYIIDGEYKLTESLAVEHYIIKKGGKKTDLLGRDAKEAAIINMLASILKGDVWKNLVELCINPNFETEKEKIFQEKIKPHLDKIQKFIGKNNFLLGEKETYPDFYLYECLCYVKGIFPDYFSKCEEFIRQYENFEKIPSMKGYMASERFIKVPFLSPAMAKWTGL